MDDTLFMHFLNALDHLDGNTKHSLQVKLPSALLEEVLKRFAQKVHHHHMVGLVVIGLFVTNEMEVRNASLASKLMNKLRFPVEHDVLLVLDSFFDLGSKVFSSLPLFDAIDFSESAPS